MDIARKVVSGLVFIFGEQRLATDAYLFDNHILDGLDACELKLEETAIHTDGSSRFPKSSYLPFLP